MEKKNRGTFSTFGFLMASAGSAIGLGNMWKFPYVAGKNGGGIFILVYLIMVLAIGFVCMMGEMVIGRRTKLNPIGAYKKIAEKFTFVGVIGVVVAFIIVTYYNIIGGWVSRYLFGYITGGGTAINSNSEAFFTSFITNPSAPIIWTAVFVLLNFFILQGGVEKGIERASKFMMPTLFVLLVIIAIRSVTLPGAAAGIEFLLKPDFSHLSFDTFSLALGQVFFSLSLGMGIIITYGSYMDKSTEIEKSAIYVPILDTLAALISGFAILPAVFAFGFEPGAGPGLIFITLPQVFESMPMGHLIGTLFFLLVLFAALSSSISLIEVPTSYLIDNFGMSRRKAVIILCVAAFIIAIPESLSNGPWTTQFFGMTFFDFMGYIAESLLMPLAGFLMCIVIGYAWKGAEEEVIDEVTAGGIHPFKSKGYWFIMIRYIAPIAIGFIWLNSSGILKLFMK